MGDVPSAAVLTVPAPLVIEIVSHNWRDDYLPKLAEYEGLRIPESWIVDYQGLGRRRYIGDPKQPTLSIYEWVEGAYQVQQVQGAAGVTDLSRASPHSRTGVYSCWSSPLAGLPPSKHPLASLGYRPPPQISMFADHG